MDSLTPATASQKQALLRRYGAPCLPVDRPVERGDRDHARSPLGARLPARPGAGRYLRDDGRRGPVGRHQLQHAMDYGDRRQSTRPRRRCWPRSAGNQKHIEQCPLYLCWVADMTLNAADLDRAEKVEFETMPWLETFLVACIDVALAAQNAVVAAELLGLSTLYIGAMRNDPERVAGAARPASSSRSSCSACASAMRPRRRRRGEAAPAAGSWCTTTL